MLMLVVGLLALLGALVEFVVEARTARKVRDGWTPKRFNGSHEQYVADYRRRLAWRFGVGVVTTAVLVVLFAVVLVLADDTTRPEIWGTMLTWLLAVLLITVTPFRSRRILHSPRRSNA